jgi:hypothetical protein
MKYNYNDMAVEIFKTATGIGFYDSALEAVLLSQFHTEEERMIIDRWRVSSLRKEDDVEILLRLSVRLAKKAKIIESAELVEKTIEHNLKVEGNMTINDVDQFKEAFHLIMQLVKKE